eukprot:SAG31_NODE_9806_length_1224_cov_7.623111_1_plen_266_part_00
MAALDKHVKAQQQLQREKDEQERTTAEDRLKRIEHKVSCELGYKMVGASTNSQDYLDRNESAHCCRRLTAKGVVKELGLTPLMCAATHGQTDCAKSLLQAGVNGDSRANTGGTALMMAVWHGHVKAAELLIVAGVDLDVQNNVGETALHWAAIQGRPAILYMLIANGANRQLASGDTVWTFKDTVQERGVTTKRGKVPLDLAVQYSNHECVKLLRAEVLPPPDPKYLSQGLDLAHDTDGDDGGEDVAHENEDSGEETQVREGVLY